MFNVTNNQGNATQNTIRYHPTSARLAIIKEKTKDNKCWQGCGENRTFMYYWLKCKLVHCGGPKNRTML